MTVEKKTTCIYTQFISYVDEERKCSYGTYIIKYARRGHQLVIIFKYILLIHFFSTHWIALMHIKYIDMHG